jgi:hypothetical protein
VFAAVRQYPVSEHGYNGGTGEAECPCGRSDD